MDIFFYNWFKGWIEGLHALPLQERIQALGSCGKACAQPEILPRYRVMLAQAESIDAFFVAVNAQAEAVTVQSITVEQVYDVCYPACGCPLHEQCGVDDPLLCECSRESLRWVLGELFPDKQTEVELMESILRGDNQCRLRIHFPQRG